MKPGPTMECFIILSTYGYRTDYVKIRKTLHNLSVDIRIFSTVYVRLDDYHQRLSVETLSIPIDMRTYAGSASDQCVTLTLTF